LDHEGRETTRKPLKSFLYFADVRDLRAPNAPDGPRPIVEWLDGIQTQVTELARLQVHSAAGLEPMSGRLQV